MGISNCNYDVRGSIRSAHVYWKVRSLYQPGKIGNAFTEANSKQQYPTVPNSTPLGLAEVFVLLCRYTFPRLAAHRPLQHTGPGTGVEHFPRLAAHRPWHWSCILSPPGSTQALALELYTFPAWQHTGPGTGVVYFPPPGSKQALALELYTFPRLAAHRPWHWSCILPPPGSTQALALELYTFPRLAAHRPWHWSCILSPAWQHAGPCTGVVYFPPPGSKHALALELYTSPAWQHTGPGTGVVNCQAAWAANLW